MNTTLKYTSIVLGLVTGSLSIGPVLASGQYDAAKTACNKAIQADLSIPDESYKHRLTHIKGRATKIELWYDVSNRDAAAGTGNYTAYCKAQKSSGKVEVLETNPVAQ